MAADPAAARGVAPVGQDGSWAAKSADPVDQAIDAFFGDEPDPQAEQAAMSRGAAAAAGGLPIAAGPNGQAHVLTNQGALPLFMSEQGPMAMTKGGPVPLQSLAQQGAVDSFQKPAQTPPQAKAPETAVEKAVKTVAAVAATAAVATVAIAAKKLADTVNLAARSGTGGAPAPAPVSVPQQYSGRSAFVAPAPARPAPAPAPVVARQAAPADLFQTTGGGPKATGAGTKTAPANDRPLATLDPKLNKQSGIGTRIGTTGSGGTN